jgi:AAA domain-containing protein
LPSLSDHQSNDFVKILLIGDAQSGKTGSLTSLVKAGYKLRILDFDNKLDVLKYFVQHECPEALGAIEFRTLRDRYTITPAGPMVLGTPKAFTDATKMLDRWKYGDIDLGKPEAWGPDCILVIDSLSRLCDAAYDWRLPLTPKGKGGEADTRATYGDAQDAVEYLLASLTSASFQTNVLVICHVAYLDLPDGTKKGFPQGVGKALSPKIPQYFPSSIQYTTRGGQRKINTVSTSLIDLANPAPFAMKDTYDIKTGLADFFKVLREPPTKV